MIENLNLAEIKYLLPHGVLLTGGLLTLMLSLRKQADLTFIWGEVTSMLALASSLFISSYFEDHTPVVFSTGDLLWDDFSGFLTPVILALGFAHFALLRLQRASYAIPELVPLMLFALVGMLFTLNSYSLLMMFISIELMSLPQYLMAGANKEEKESSEAAIKYFILGALSSCILLLGISYFYGLFGGVEFALIKEKISLAPNHDIVTIIATLLVLSALFFKLSLVPFHMWAPDVYHGVPFFVMSFFATAPKVATLALVIRLVCDIFKPLFFHLQPFLIAASILSIVVGAVGAIGQYNLKRLFAYSGIGNLGFILMGLVSGSPSGIEAAIIYLLAYNLTLLGIFMILLYGKNGSPINDLSELSSLSDRNSFMAVGISLFLFSLIGIPPLPGFFGKFYILFSLIEQNSWYLSVFFVLGSVVASYYSLRMLKRVWFVMGSAVTRFSLSSVLRSEVLLIFILLLLASSFFIFAIPYLQLNLSYAIKSIT